MNDKIFFKNDYLKIINDDFISCSEIKENSVDLIITSPPYNVDIKYNSHNDQLTYFEYLEFTKKWLARCYELLKNDGRFCLNIPLDKNKGGQQSVGADLTVIAKKIGFKYHSSIVWNEGNISRRTAWGSWLSASAPFVIAPVELIVILYKNIFGYYAGVLLAEFVVLVGIYFLFKETRHCSSYESMDVHIKRVERMLPPEGKISIMFLT